MNDINEWKKHTGWVIVGGYSKTNPDNLIVAAFGQSP